MYFDIRQYHFMFKIIFKKFYYLLESSHRVRQEILQIGKKWTDLSTNWNPDDGYKNDTVVPLNVKSSEHWNSVEFILSQKSSFYGCSNKQGFTVKYIESYDNYIRYLNCMINRYRYVHILYPLFNRAKIKKKFHSATPYINHKLRLVGTIER